MRCNFFLKFIIIVIIIIIIIIILDKRKRKLIIGQNNTQDWLIEKDNLASFFLVFGFECLLLTKYFKARSKSVDFRESSNIRKNFRKIMKNHNVVVGELCFMK